MYHGHARGVPLRKKSLVMPPAKAAKNKKKLKILPKAKTTPTQSLRIRNHSIEIEEIPFKAKKVPGQLIQIPSLKAIKSYSKQQAKKSLISKITKKVKKFKPLKAVKSVLHGKRPTAVRPQLKLDAEELPAAAKKPWLSLWVKDPFWVFASWEIPPAVLHSYQKKFRSGAKMVLRIFDRSAAIVPQKKSTAFFDLDVGAANNWYVHLWKDDLTLAAVLGIRSGIGKFMPLAESKTIQTPRAGVSTRCEQIWMKNGDHPGIPYLWLKKKTTESRRFQKVYLSSEDLRRYYGEKLPLENSIAEGLSGEQSLEKKHLDFKEYLQFRRSGTSEEWLGEITGSSHLGSEGLSSFGYRSRERQFFFEISAEVKIYGRTQPDAKVWLDQEKISLHKDGTFTLRYNLPDMTIPLSFKAVAADRLEERTIETEINRHSAYKIPKFHERQVA